MKKASKFEKVAARCWNLLNEGKPFTPIFTIGTMILFQLIANHGQFNMGSFLIGFLLTLPLFVIYYLFDFPLFLRNYLWIPLIGFLLLGGNVTLSMWILAIALYFFFTIIFWGSIYYHLRIGTTLLNFTRFWKLVLKNSDSTSGNAQEQLPKFLLILAVWQAQYNQSISGSYELISLGLFYVGILLFTVILHHYLFDWKPEIISSYTNNVAETMEKISNKVVIIVVDGMRKDRFEVADTPFLNKLRDEGTEYTQMETVYPARTVVCFTSMFTGTYPFEHGITSNMVWRLGSKVDSVFDSLRKINKKGKLLGIAHLVDSLGETDVETVTAVMKNDVADKNIIERAKMIVDADDPDLLVVQLIGTDQTGHSRGVHYDEYLEKINEADLLIEEFVDYLTKKGKMDNTTLLICADHGQADGIGGHGHLDEGERFVPFILHGPSIYSGKRITEKHSLVSIASTVAYLLGAPFPTHSRGPVLMDAIRRDATHDK